MRILNQLTWQRILCAAFFATALFATSALADESDKPKPAIGGFDPVSYFADDGPAEGKAELSARFRGHLYYFASEENKKKFTENPEKYAPQWGGLCACALGGTYGNRFPGDPTVYEVHNNKLFLFSMERAKRAFDTDPARYVNLGDERWNDAKFDGHCLVSTNKQGKAVKGDKQHRSTYGEWVYYFASEEAKKEFEKNPEKWLPAYEGHCAAAMADGKQYEGTPEAMRVEDGRLFFFWDEDDAKDWEKDKKANIAKADSEWGKFVRQREKEEQERVERAKQASKRNARPAGRGGGARRP